MWVMILPAEGVIHSLTTEFEITMKNASKIEARCLSNSNYMLVTWRRILARYLKLLSRQNPCCMQAYQCSTV
jgi:hypothetical protein